MRKWIVSWEIDIESDTADRPFSAAMEALSYVQNYKTPVLKVTDSETGKSWSVDFEEPTEVEAVLEIDQRVDNRQPLNNEDK